MIEEYVRLASANIVHRKVRSSLTIIGIVIGVASIVALVLISQGLENAIREQFEEFGTDKIFVLPANYQGETSTAELNVDDVRALETVSELDYVIPMFAQQAIMEYKDDTISHYLVSWPSDRTDQLVEDFAIKTEEGRWFTSDSDQIVLGSLVPEDLFEDEVRINNRIVIQGKKFTVVGILESVGNPTDDAQIYMPLAVMRDLYDDQESVSFIQAKAKAGADVNRVAEKMEDRLSRIRSEESFDVSTFEQFLEQLDEILGVVQGVLVGIATIALVVGAVGIANSMYTSVRERTRDIGIMKSVGATNANILTVFLLESAIIGLIGGLVGIAFGAMISFGLVEVAKSAGFDLFKIVLDPILIVFTLVFAMGVGMVSGALPARQAAEMKPVEAMRKK